MTPIETDVTILGAGIVGLAVAQRLAPDFSVLLFEKHTQFGMETSSRNSEVVHSGIYYSPDSLKTHACIEGRKRLYQFCEEYDVPYRKTGKFVLATGETGNEYLDRLFIHAQNLSIPVTRHSQSELQKQIPLAKTSAGLFFPESGIVDSHLLMSRLERCAHRDGALFNYGYELVEVAIEDQACKLSLRCETETIQVRSSYVINAMGLASADWSNRALNTEKYAHQFSRGRYFHLNEKYRNAFSKLIYPTPEKEELGVHITLDLANGAKLGPDAEWLDETRYENLTPFYDCNWELLRPKFLAKAQRILPNLRSEDMHPGQIGIRAKLFVDQKRHPDFLVERHGPWIHCLGIESPGLTSALALADNVQKLIP